MGIQTGHRYALAVSLPAIEIGINSSGRLTRIPKGSLVRVEGVVNAEGIVNVRWQDTVFGVFEVDLVERSQRAAVGAV